MNVCTSLDRLTDTKERIEMLLPNQAVLLTILSSQRASKTALPSHLGLDDFEFAHLTNRYCITESVIPTPNTDTYRQNSQTRSELLELRRGEWQELVALLVENSKGVDISEKWLAKILATACMGNGHLWRDLGLADRPQSELFRPSAC